MSLFRTLTVFSGNSNRPLVEPICAALEVPLGRAVIDRFSDGEIHVRIEENVRGQDIYVLQSLSTPVNDHLMELLIMTDALRRASARSITAVLPYYGYARQDRKAAPRTPISAKLVADLLTAAGISRIIAMDLHAGQIQGFFNIPFDHLFAMPVLLEHLKRTSDADTVVVSPDAGGVERARAYAKRVPAGLAIIDKRRSGPNVSEVMHIVGDVKGKDCVILDDMIDTAGTLTQAAKAIADAGARRVRAMASHAVMSGPAPQRIRDSVLDEVVVTDTIPLRPEVAATGKVKVLSVARLLAEAIKRIHQGDSVSSLFV
ncbi:MAG TPA: ribose-phosphate pyrophosphokinase [Myxococcota bacterium]|jgi:ribose-phosphate pyrophosphokinase|nr:ribose-phosphate pyrophosphokinase [Myxococcota bacterium]